jgi:hypothetical protein
LQLIEWLTAAEATTYPPILDTLMAPRFLPLFVNQAAAPSFERQHVRGERIGRGARGGEECPHKLAGG